jgi:hypothetical protein
MVSSWGDPSGAKADMLAFKAALILSRALWSRPATEPLKSAVGDDVVSLMAAEPRSPCFCSVLLAD